MPGGRLTDHDRRTIATGLAGGLGYAEIARRLGRPTSTISREVARNHGPAGYRADHAHLATGHRARRRNPARPAEPRTDEARDFSERFAALMVRSGLPRTAARVFATLITTDAGAMTAAGLSLCLRVSAASISKAVHYLEGLDLIQRERDPHRRRDRYLIDDDVWLQTWLTSARTHAVWADAAEQGARILGAGTPAGARLRRMSGFFAQLSDDMAGRSALAEPVPSATEFAESGAAATDDAFTALAALVHAARPLTADRLATALGWSLDRVRTALRTAALQPAAIAGPVTVERTADGAYTAGAASALLAESQRKALSRP